MELLTFYLEMKNWEFLHNKMLKHAQLTHLFSPDESFSADRPPQYKPCNVPYTIFSFLCCLITSTKHVVL